MLEEIINLVRCRISNQIKEHSAVNALLFFEEMIALSNINQEFKLLFEKYLKNPSTSQAFSMSPFFDQYIEVDWHNLILEVDSAAYYVFRSIHHKQLSQKLNTLSCACCGSYTQGRQWYNRDQGFGICPSCADWILGRSGGEEEMLNHYGIETVHWVPTGKSFNGVNQDATVNHRDYGVNLNHM